jgi:hypothetical protein
MPREFSFEKLTVWKESKELAVRAHKTCKRFPADEKFGLVSPFPAT